MKLLNIHFCRTKIWIISFVLIFQACNIDKDRKFDPESIDFTTTESSELFFKNVRQSDYDKVEMKEAGMDLFRMSDRNAEADYPLIHLAIAFNWRLDKAHIMIEPNEFVMPTDSIRITARSGQTSEETEILYTMGNLIEQAAFAAAIYNAIQDGQSLILHNAEGEVPIFDKASDREVFRKTVLDYYRLIDIVH